MRLHVRADNVTTLTRLRKLRVKGVGLTRISPEMALDIATATYEPDVLEHTPGIQNGVADMLSRVYDPSDKFKMPRYLEHAVQAIPPVRNQKYWLSVSPPTTAPSAAAKRKICGRSRRDGGGGPKACVPLTRTLSRRACLMN